VHQELQGIGAELGILGATASDEIDDLRGSLAGILELDNVENSGRLAIYHLYACYPQRPYFGFVEVGM
jgi:hypothetical protein